MLQLQRTLLTLVCLTASVSIGVSSAAAFTTFDTGVTGGSPESSLIGVTVTSADVGDSFDIDWLVDSSVLGTSDQLSATANYSVVSLDDTTLVLDVVIHNTTVLSSTLTNADILSTGFGVDPDATATLLSPGSLFDGVGDGSGPNQTYPGGFKAIDVCVFGQNCSGGSVAQGLGAGDSDSFRLMIVGDFSGKEVDLLFFPAKFQTNIGSFEPGGAGGPPIPEPSAALLFAVGAVAFRRGVNRRR